MIIVIGPFPPPVHGAALVTQRATEKLIAAEIPLLICDTSPGKGAGQLRYHLKRILAYVRCGGAILRSRRETAGPIAVYLSLSGGLGLFYDFIVVLLARWKQYKVIFHHHSFSYVTERSRLMRAIIRAAGAHQLHIALCNIMAAKLKERYDLSLRAEVISNFAFFDTLDDTPKNTDGNLGTIGYLSNISFEKGIDRFLDLMAELRANGSRLSGRIAGPFADEQVRQYVEGRIRQIGQIEYVGAVFGDSKSRFLSSIDMLIFPTRYVHEAQPLVVYEAQAAGIVVSASDRGCIAEMIPAQLRLDSTASNLGKIVEQILSWERNPGLFIQALREAGNHRLKLAEQRMVDSARFDGIFSEYK